MEMCANIANSLSLSLIFILLLLFTCTNKYKICSVWLRINTYGAFAEAASANHGERREY